MLSADYKRGFNAGLKAGMRQAMRESIARTIMNKDLVYAYGSMALVLHELNRWDTDSIENLIEEIQNQWTRLLEEDEVDGSLEQMADLVERRTGVRLEQRVTDIVEEDL